LLGTAELPKVGRDSHRWVGVCVLEQACMGHQVVRAFASIIEDSDRTDGFEEYMERPMGTDPSRSLGLTYVVRRRL